MIPVLFVGGPRDGERILYTRAEPLSEYIVVQEPEITSVMSFGSAHPEVLCSTRSTGYRLGWLRTTEDHAVYIAEHLSMEDALHAAMYHLGVPVVDMGAVPRSVAAPLLWHSCAGRAHDRHDEVRWQGGPDCWVCGQPGAPVGAPKIKDQEVAPYGWT